MISYELEPSDKNIRETLIRNTLGRNDGIVSFVELLNVIDGNSVIAIDDTWGSGKTFFVKQIHLVLKSCFSSMEEDMEIRQKVVAGINLEESKKYIPIYYDAWSNDNDCDPVLSIVNEMLQELAVLKNYELSDIDWNKRLKTSVDLVIRCFGGPSIKDFLNALDSEDPLKELRKTKEREQILDELFNVILQECGEKTRIIFFIDELDRCRPDFAVKVLERIKHYFYHENVNFVISINAKELQHTIKRYYGEEFNACKYLTKFFNFTITLPLPNYENYYDMLDFSHRSYIRDSLAEYIIKYYNFSLRDITRYLQVLRIAIPKRYRGCEYDAVKMFYMEVIVPFLLGLKIHNINQYEEFIHGENGKVFIEMMQTGCADRYCRVLLNDNETFTAINNGKNSVSLEERFYVFYNAFFGIDSRGALNYNEVEIGKNRFLTSDKKKWIMDVISFMAINT